MRILFLWPGIYMGWNILNKGFEQSAINHGLCSISAGLKMRGHDCFLMDLRAYTGWDNFEAVLRQQTFAVALIGFHSVDESYADQAIRLVKKHFPDKPVIAGGVHITYNQVETFSQADCVIWGEGDIIVEELLQMIEAGRNIPQKLIAPMIENLDALPFIDRLLFNIKFEQNHPLFPLLPVPCHTINFSRGCPWHCTFCLESKNILWKKVRTRSPENCIAEIKSLEPVGSLMIHDDHLPAGNWIYGFLTAWDREIGRRIPFWCQLRADWICKHKDIIPILASIGMTIVSLGIEGSQKMLDFYNKKLTSSEIIKAAEILHQNKINIFGNYILAAPTETEQDISELELILQQIRPEYHSPSIWTSYPGSLLYDFCKKNDLWYGDPNDLDNYYDPIRIPYSRKMKNVDYKKIQNEIIPRFVQYKSELKIYAK